MSPSASLQRLFSMDRREFQFRAACATRKIIERASVAVAAPRWHREAFASIVAEAGRSEALATAVAASTRGAWTDAHRALAAHVASRESAFPLVPVRLPALSSRILAAFPQSRQEAAARADRMLGGAYDLLGYRNLQFGAPPRWDYDPVHGRPAPGGFWASVPYLDPSAGDHKSSGRSIGTSTSWRWAGRFT